MDIDVDSAGDDSVVGVIGSVSGDAVGTTVVVATSVEDVWVDGVVDSLVDMPEPSVDIIAAPLSSADVVLDCPIVVAVVITDDFSVSGFIVEDVWILGVVDSLVDMPEPSVVVVVTIVPPSSADVVLDGAIIGEVDITVDVSVAPVTGEVALTA